MVATASDEGDGRRCRRWWREEANIATRFFKIRSLDGKGDRLQRQRVYRLLRLDAAKKCVATGVVDEHF